MSAVARAEEILRAACGDRIRTSFSLAPLTTFRIGGPAALFLEPESMRDLTAASRAVRESGVPVVVVGKGSNVLVSDTGFPGLVLRLGRGFRWAEPAWSWTGAALASGLNRGIGCRRDLDRTRRRAFGELPGAAQRTPSGSCSATGSTGTGPPCCANARAWTLSSWPRAPCRRRTSRCSAWSGT